MTNPKHFQPFGCPVYVLDNALLQSNRPIQKWTKRSRVGVNLGHSPLHGKNISLVLNRETGLVSPQFHVKYDPLLQTVQQDDLDSKWQQKAGLISSKEIDNIIKSAIKPSKKAGTKMTKKSSQQDVMSSSEGADDRIQKHEGATITPSRKVVRWDKSVEKLPSLCKSE